MQHIAREFNYSETTFVLPPELPSHTRRVRIFTPGGEVPFAGHPTVGTAHVLAAIGEVRLTGDVTPMIFEEGVGPVPVMVRAESGRPVFAQMSVAKLPEVGPPPPPRAALAELLSIDEADLLDGEWAPQAVSCGLPFLFVPLRSVEAVARARAKADLLEATLAAYWTQMVFVFALGGERAEIHGRMFAPTIGVPEDPATGSACAALGGYLAARDTGARDGTRRWVVEQGVEMGRPSILELEVDREGGAVTGVRVGGQSVLVSEGAIEVPE
jgi:trans-2,3-dihydro-3-hydroxyanthranilate isomerase